MTGAPLISIPEAPAPAGGEAAWFKGADGADLRAAIFPPKGRALGSIVLSGGRTEPIEKYFEVIQDLTGRGYVVLAHDWRGQGLSHRELPDRLAGHASGYEAFLTDYRALLATYEARLPKPWFAIGHSMGGCLTLLALAHGEAARFEGAILSAPMLGLQMGGIPLPAARLLAGFNRLIGRAGRYVRAETAVETFENNILTHDRTRYERAKAQVAAHPDLGLGAPTWGWIDFALRATGYLARPDNLRSVAIPVIILSAEQDRLVDNAAQIAVARNLPRGEFISVPGAYHEILMETDPMRNFFLRALDALLGKSAPAAPTTSEAKPVAPAALKAEAPVKSEPEPTAKAPPAEPDAAPAPVASTNAVKPAAKKAAPKAAEPKTTASKTAAPKAPAKASAAKSPAAEAAKASPKPAAKAKPATKAPPARKTAAVKAPAPAKASAPKAATKAKAPELAASPAKKPTRQAAAVKTTAAPALKPAPAKAAKPAAAKPAAEKPAAEKPAVPAKKAAAPKSKPAPKA